MTNVIRSLITGNPNAYRRFTSSDWSELAGLYPSPEPRPTAPCKDYTPHALLDEAYWSGFSVGFDQIPANPPTGYRDPERKAWLAGYGVGYSVSLDSAPHSDYLPDTGTGEDDREQAWDEYKGRNDDLDSMYATNRDELNEWEARSEFAGHGGYADLD